MKIVQVTRQPAAKQVLEEVGCSIFNDPKATTQLPTSSLYFIAREGIVIP